MYSTQPLKDKTSCNHWSKSEGEHHHISNNSLRYDSQQVKRGEHQPTGSLGAV